MLLKKVFWPIGILKGQSLFSFVSVVDQIIIDTKVDQMTTKNTII